jgi:Spy/CpxP family protein refolding chaperone
MANATPTPISTFARPGGWRLLAAATLLALLSAFALSAWAHPGYGQGPRGGMGDSPERATRMVEHMLRGVDASDEQRRQIRDIAQRAAADLKAQRDAGRTLRERQMQLFTQPNVDAAAVEALRQQMLQQHDQMSRRVTQAMLDASRVLTPEQRAKLAERMKQRRDMAERHRRERAELAPPPAR